MISPAIQRSIEVQEAAQKCGIIKPKMVRIVRAVNKSLSYLSADIIADEINEFDANIMNCKSWQASDIADLIIEIIRS